MSEHAYYQIFGVVCSLAAAQPIIYSTHITATVIPKTWIMNQPSFFKPHERQRPFTILCQPRSFYAIKSHSFSGFTLSSGSSHAQCVTTHWYLLEHHYLHSSSSSLLRHLTMANLRKDHLLVNSSMTSGSPLVPQFSPSLSHGQGEQAALPPSAVSAPPTSGLFFFWCSCNVLIFRIVPNYSSYSQQRSGQTNPGCSFSPLDIVEQYTNLTDGGSFALNDQDSIRSALQFFFWIHGVTWKRV